MSEKLEVLISVDIETSGPIPGEYSMLSIGACLVDDDQHCFEVKLKPINENADPKALEVTGLSMETLLVHGEEPAAAMLRFSDWIKKVAPQGSTPVFVGFNAAFDWSFVNYYFHRFTSSNPFGFTALDIKAYFMGAAGVSWEDTKSSRMAKRLHPRQMGDHDALQDAKYQAELFRLTRKLTQEK
jgi:ribonuclease T